VPFKACGPIHRVIPGSHEQVVAKVPVLPDRGPFEFRKSGGPGRPIVFRGVGDGEAVLEANGTDEKADVVRISEADHLMFENLTFRSGRTLERLIAAHVAIRIDPL
jgi:hypothetical protein